MEPEHRATIRTTNLATFVSSVFCGHDVGFIELNDHFIKTFTPDGAPLEKEPGELYLNLKTQMYLSAVSQEEQERTREDILEDFFPNGIEELLEDRHLDTPLTDTEIEFVKSFNSRRDFLANAPIDVDSIRESQTSAQRTLLTKSRIIIREICLGRFFEAAHQLLEQRTIDCSLYETSCSYCTGFSSSSIPL